LSPENMRLYSKIDEWMKLCFPDLLLCARRQYVSSGAYNDVAIAEVTMEMMLRVVTETTAIDEDVDGGDVRKKVMMLMVTLPVTIRRLRWLWW